MKMFYIVSNLDDLSDQFTAWVKIFVRWNGGGRGTNITITIEQMQITAANA
jgi:hypothetical protein